MKDLITFANCLDRYSHPMPIVKDLSLRRCSFVERIRAKLLPALLNVREQTIIWIATQLLQKAPRVTPEDAFRGRIVYILRQWINETQEMRRWSKLTKEQKEKTPLREDLQTLKTELSAYRLGITSDNLKASEGLEKFVEEKAYLHNYLAFYKHTLRVADTQSPIQIMMNGDYVDWNEAKETIVDKPDAEGLWPWKYGQMGLQNSDLCTWKGDDVEERAFTQKKHPSPGKYLFTYCIYSSSHGPRISGDHAWLRLTTAKGKVYDVGKNRPPRVFKPSNALSDFKGMLQCLDISSPWPKAPTVRAGEQPLRKSDGTRRTKIHFEITEENFEAALKRVKEMQADDKLIFGLFEQSCVVFANEIANICGIRIDTRASMLKLRLPPPLISLTDRVMKFVPNFLANIVYFVPGVLSNVFLCATLGGRLRSPETNRRYFSSLRDLLNPNKSLLHHPWYLATQIKKDVEANRPAGSPFGIPQKYQAPAAA